MQIFLPLCMYVFIKVRHILRPWSVQQYMSVSPLSHAVVHSHHWLIGHLWHQIRTVTLWPWQRRVKPLATFKTAAGWWELIHLPTRLLSVRKTSSSILIILDGHFVFFNHVVPTLTEFGFIHHHNINSNTFYCQCISKTQGHFTRQQ